MLQYLLLHLCILSHTFERARLEVSFRRLEIRSQAMEGKERRLLLPRERDPNREMSPAMLNLERVYEQTRHRSQKKEAAKMPEIPTLQTKTKPRLLLMGQRRYERVDSLSVTEAKTRLTLESTW